jgi:hypothetical protein
VAGSNPDVVGIDFSGAQDAGRHIWVTEGTVSSGVLNISSCNKAQKFTGTVDRNSVFADLVSWIDSLTDATVGIDFPFGVPETVAEAVFGGKNWSGFVNSRHWSGLSPDRFRQQCKNFCNSELRDTDAMHRADCPYSVRIYKQTADNLLSVSGDKGYDWQELRDDLRSCGVRPLTQTS